MPKEPSTTAEVDKIITIKEAAAITGYTVRRLRKYAAANRIGGAFQIVKHGPWEFRKSLLLEWWAAQGK